MAKREPYNVEASLRDTGALLMVTVALDVEPRPSGTGKSLLYGSTGFPVRIEHPTIPGLWYSVTVGSESPEYSEAKSELAAAKAKLAAWKASKAQKDS